MNKQSCDLCTLALSPSFHLLGDKRFCCRGCLTVYEIIHHSSQNQVSTAQNLLDQAKRIGILSDPSLLIRHEEIQEIKEAIVTSKERWHFEIRGMWCTTCAKLIELILYKSKAIYLAKVDYITDLCLVEYDPMKISKEHIIEKIQSFGYRCVSLENILERSSQKALKIKLGLSTFLSMNIMMLSYPIYENGLGIKTEGFHDLLAYISLVLSLPLIFYVGLPIFKRAFHSIKWLLFGMETLITIGVFSSFILSIIQLFKGSSLVYFDSMAMIITFVLWGRVMEDKAKSSLKEKLNSLEKMLPKKARIETKEGVYEYRPIKEVKIGQEILTFMGEQIVLDAVVVEGEAYVDESFLTGEAEPKFKGVKSGILAGSIIKSGFLRAKVVKEAQEASLYRIVQLLTLDMQNKNKDQRTLIDKICQFFVPTVVLLAFIQFVYVVSSFGPGEALMRSLAVLLISCPCALSVAVTLVEASLIGKLAQKGIIVKNRLVIHLMKHIKKIIFDKTGTLTAGELKLVSLVDLTYKEKKILKALSCLSSHPVSRALSLSLDDEPALLLNREEIAGSGVKGVFENETYYLGSKRFLKEMGCSVENEEEGTFFATKSRILSQFVFEDPLKTGIKDEVASISIAEKIILSGDHMKNVEKVAKAVKIDEFYAELSPFEKRAKIESWQREGKKVMMVGDGINDSLSLSGADIGISLLSGAELSCNASHVILTKSSLIPIQELILYCKKAKKIIFQNLFWAFIYNIVGLVLAFMGVFSPIIAAICMVLSSTIVILNSRRV